jgi:drug/metabolite transporter (DMT)-like permease
MQYLGEICALLTACCWSGSALTFSAAAVRVGSVRLNVTRLIVASVILLAIVLVGGISSEVTSGQLRYLILSGIAGLIIGDSFLFKAYEMIGARIGMLIVSSAPAISALLAYALLGEELGFSGFIGMFVTLLGIAIVVLERRNVPSAHQVSYVRGILYAFVGAAGQGGGLVLAKMAFNDGPVNGFFATTIRIISAVVVIYPIAFVAGAYKDVMSAYMKDTTAVWCTLLGTILGPCFGITLSLISVAHTSVGISATLMATVPILMLPIIRFGMKEEISWRAVGGAIIAVGGVAILFLPR